jgi:hypothetical protein
VEILAELGKTEKSLMTPLIGFSAFTAALTHAHVAAFPHVNLGRSTKAEERADAGMAYLVLFTKTWKMGEEWVSTRRPNERLADINPPSGINANIFYCPLGRSRLWMKLATYSSARYQTRPATPDDMPP